MIISKMDEYYPPIKKSSIKQIYPWLDCLMDHLFFIFFICTSPVTKEYFYGYSQKIKKYFNGKEVFFLNSGRSALVLALSSLGIKRKDKVAITAFNCPAVIDSILNVGADPIFVDINDCGGFNLKQLKKITREGVKAIIVTHVYGIVDNIKEIEKICRAENVFIINDLAQVNSFISNDINEFGDVQVYSFGPEKPIFSLNMGIITTRDESIASKISEKYTQKTVSSVGLVSIFINRWKYYFTFFINKYLPSLISLFAKNNLIYLFKDKKEDADIKLYENITIKKANPFQVFLAVMGIEKYRKRIIKTESNFLLLKNRLNTKVELIAPENYKNIVPHYATIRVGKDRFLLSKYLAENGVATVWNYYPLYKYVAYSNIAGRANLSETDKIWKQVLSLPFRYPLSEKSIIKIADLVNNFYGN